MPSALPPYIALGSRLRGIPEVQTLGVKPNFFDYTPDERELIAGARLILYPTLNYAQFFTTTGRPIFPSVETYLYADDKIKQTTLINMAGIPHPRTRFYYRPQHRLILRDFDFPFVAKIPRASARGRGVFLITSDEELKRYCGLTRVAYIQEFLPHERDLRVVLINYKCVLAYWRKRAANDFRTNLHQGGTIDFDQIPDQAIAMAQQYARCCKLNDVGLDLIYSKDNW
jgi:ribosomal protein S6--L-glutamate ligase